MRWLRLPPPVRKPQVVPVDRPPGAGWWWWRQDEFDSWTALLVRVDGKKNGELYVLSSEDHHYQCDGDPEHEWYGEWWPVPLEPPSKPRRIV